MTIVRLHVDADEQKAPIRLTVHMDTTLNITAENARRQVNQRIVIELGTGLIAREPELVVAGEQIIWRVPIVLSLPGLGNVGQVGAIDVDAHTGDIIPDARQHQAIVQHAQRLYAGATLSTK
jgi:hypothetical protein